jgi:hypothetical protein
VKKTCAFQWETLGEPNVLVEVSLSEDSKGFHWSTGVTVNGEYVLDFMSRDDMKDLMPEVHMRMTMLRDDILETLRRDFDRELTAIKNDLF